jgi:hypothetical protein
LGDGEAHLEDLIVAAKDHGAGYVIAGGMTMDGVQAERTLAAAGRVDPAVEGQWRELYNQNAKPNSPVMSAAYTAKLGRMVRELCEKHGILDRMPRPIWEGPLTWNKRLAEKLLLKTYELELEQGSPQKIWAYRKAGWMVDEMEESIVDMYNEQGVAGLQALPTIGRSLANQIADWLNAHQLTRN